VAVVSLTGLGLKGSSLIVGAAGGTLVLAAIYSAVAVLVLGLAVPVTASFIISAVIVGPALIELGVVATEVGRRTLVVDGRRLPLYQPGRPPVRVVLSVRG
jgi:TRAP-type uncharacterized transport system fused permease subunit